MDLIDKVALVTGATSGIGEAIAIKLAANGATVILTGRDEERGKQVEGYIKAAGGQASFVQSDLLNKKTPKRLIEEALRIGNKLDIVINNAALICNKRIEAVTHEDWDTLFSVNVKAPFFIIQEALPALKKERGVVLNISSINATVNNYNNVIYDSLKSALNHMTTGLAMDLFNEGVRFNALMPGGTETPNLSRWFQQVHADNLQKLIQVENEVKSDPKIATPEQIASAALFLVSDAANWVNGALIPIDGGVHLLK